MCKPFEDQVGCWCITRGLPLLSDPDVLLNEACYTYRSFSELSARTTNTFGTLQTFTRYTETCSQNISVFLKLKRVKSLSQQLKQCGV